MNRPMLPPISWSDRRRFLKSFAAYAATGSSLVAAEQNKWENIAPFFEPPEEWRGQYGDYRSPLIFKDGSKVETAADWARRRKEIRADWMRLMGPWPKLITNPVVQTIEETRRENFLQIKIRFKWTPTEHTTGYLLIPDGKGRRPAAVTVYYEPETAIGLGKSRHRDFALQLARRGFVTFSIGTTVTTQNRTYAIHYPSIEKATVQPLSMLAYAAANAWHLLARRPEVDSERIGILGHSYGGKWAMFASCLFERFACAAWSDPGIVLDTRPSINYWEPWYLGWHPRPWRKRGVPTSSSPVRGLYPRLLKEGRDLHELHALMAPRPFLVSGGSEDSPSRWSPLNHSIAVCKLLGLDNRVAMTNRPEHSPDAASNTAIYDFFEHFLK
jgi:dienelactone hydrolase